MTNRKTLGNKALLLMIFTAVFAFNNIINNSINIGLATIPAFMFSIVFYFLPFGLMIGEFASASVDKESGIHSWIELSLGPKMAFLGAWAYFFVNLFYFTALLPAILIYASYTFLGRNAFGANASLIVSIFSIILFLSGTWISTKGPRGISKVTNISGFARMFIGVAFIVLAFMIVLVLTGGRTAQPFVTSTIMPKFDWAFFATMAWILQAVGGAESIGVYIKDIKGGNRAFIKTVILATVLIGVLYTLGCVAVGFVVPKTVLLGNYTNALFDAFKIIGKAFGISHGVANVVGLIMLLSGLGSLVIWISAPVKVLFSEIPKGILGKRTSEIDENGTPKNALWIQAGVVSVLLLIPALGIASVNLFLKTLLNMIAATSLIPVLFFIISYIMLRLKKDDTPRSFRVTKNKNWGILIGIIMLLLFLFTFFVALVPNPSYIIDALTGAPIPKGVANPLMVLGYNVGGVVIFMSFALYRWKKYIKKQKI